MSKLTKKAHKKLNYICKLNAKLEEVIDELENNLKYKTVENNTLMNFNDITCELKEKIFEFIDFLHKTNFDIRY